ncbi:MAG: glutamate synthase large subunit [SAR86 cluster bacterium]|nr:glutamate synthase large subunit [SAR86 cluster bacterium]
MSNKLSHKDNCGTGVIFSKTNTPSNSIIFRSLLSLSKMKHRGAVSHDGETPDGCGILIDLDRKFFQKVLLDEQKIILPSNFAVGVFFVNNQFNFYETIEKICNEHDVDIIAKREINTDKKLLGNVAAKSCPSIYQLFVKPKKEESGGLEINLYKIKKLLDKKFNPENEIYCVSLSSQTIVYKGLVQPKNFSKFYTDLSTKEHVSASAVFHIRFSTNTSPKWHLAQPYRVLAHNGEINTISGNRNWAHARTKIFSSDKLGNLNAYEPLIGQTGSDSSSLDHILDLFTNGGINIGRAARMLIPPSWQNTDLMDADEKAFHEYNSMHMEAWDGPAFVCYQNKDFTSCFLDRNGLRPARIEIFDDDTVSVASEVGSNYIDDVKPINTGRLGPGGLLLFDRKNINLLLDEDVDKMLSKSNPYREWLKQKSKHLEANLHEYSGPQMREISDAYFNDSAKTFQLSQEEINTLFQYSEHGGEPTGSMGDDTPIAPLSNKIRSIYDYCRQRFAQVTNPPIDSLREKSAMSLETCIGPELNIFQETPEHAERIVVNSPILSHKKFNLLIKNKKFKTSRFSLEYDRSEQLEDAMKNLLTEIINSVQSGYSIIVLDEKQTTKNKPVINALLMTSALHHKLIEKNLRVKANIIVNTASARDNHQIACLIGFGATCVHPWLGLQTILKQSHKSRTDFSTSELCVSYRKSLNKGLLKIMSKMGISNVSSYRGAGLFEVVGLSDKINNICFPKNFSYIKGECFQDFHAKALAVIDCNVDDNIIAKGLHKYVHGGEQHAYNPDTVTSLQNSLKNNSFKEFRKFTSTIDNRNPLAVRDFFEFRSNKPSINVNDVEPIESILKRFDSAGMSLGSLSPKAHETLAAAMNGLGCRSNSGEGGEDVKRYGTNIESKIKQVASGRFGVTPNYLANAEVIQIKIAQGAKPGEGGQLPGSKVDSYIAELRYSKPGITLISPPPHHDIYSIEDLAQLIFDLKEVNPKAMISVKLVSEPGVGIVAAGVVKANADFITISGHDGGTGASPISSIRHAGSPWETGMFETQNILLESNLRSYVKLQTDGGLKTGQDVIKAAIFGADSFGFGTAPMIAMGCKYLRICHLNNCATGVATQHVKIIDEQFNGEVQKVQNFFLFVAEEVREYLANLGYKSLDEIIGNTALLNYKSGFEEKGERLGLDALKERFRPNKRQFNTNKNKINSDLNDYSLSLQIDKKLQTNISKGKGGSFSFNIQNTHRSIGAKLAGTIAKKYGKTGFPEKLTLNFKGTAGQSFGCWNSKGVDLILKGSANDYVGKGMNGGKIIISKSKSLREKRSVIAGNTCLFGATGGEFFGNGTVGERFAVRNSGAKAIIEGAGDHCCEYMTGGEVVILGPVGNNFGAGMTGGFAYVFDEDRSFVDKCNKDLVSFNRITSQDMEAHRSYLKDRIYRFLTETKSKVAEEILGDFDRYQSLFWIVTPDAENLSRIIKNTREEAA